MLAKLVFLMTTFIVTNGPYALSFPYKEPRPAIMLTANNF